MKNLKSLGQVVVLAVVCSFGALQAASLEYEITITNITKGQILSPAVAVIHNPQMQLFRLGEPAGAGVAAVAEDADATQLLDMLNASPHVMAVAQSGGPIMPGASTTFRIDGGHFSVSDRLSLIGMLVTTNDAFYALNSVHLPFFFPHFRESETRTFLSVAYDAGSEENNEDCAFVPGPPCGNIGVRATEGAEGYVHVHSGIHGIGDVLTESAFDWHNPVVKITVRPVSE